MTTTGGLRLWCGAGVERATGRNHPTVTCKEPVVAIILTEDEIWHAGDVQEDLLIANGYCSEHAPEAVHEMRSSAFNTEFLAVEVKSSLLDRVEAALSDGEITGQSEHRTLADISAIVADFRERGQS